MQQPSTYFELLKAISVPNNFLGWRNDSGFTHTMAMGNKDLKNRFVTDTDFLSWTDENGLSYTTVNDAVVKDFLSANGYGEVFGPRKFDAECVGKIGSPNFERVIDTPFSADGSGLLYRVFAGYLNYCVQVENAFYVNGEEQPLDFYEELEKLSASVFSEEAGLLAKSNVPNFNTDVNGLDLAQENQELLKFYESFESTEDDCQ